MLKPYTKTEYDVIYVQLASRKTDFETMLVTAAARKDVARIREISSYIENIESILSKTLHNISEVKQ